MSITRNHVIHVGALLLALTPFLSIPAFYFSYLTTKLVLFALAVCIIVGVGIVRMRTDDSFAGRVNSVARLPVVSIFALFVTWLGIRSLGAGAGATLWWGNFTRNEGVFFYLALLAILIIIGAWYSNTRERSQFISAWWRWYGRVVMFTTVISAISYKGLELSGRFGGSVGNALYFSGLLLFLPCAMAATTHRFERIALVLTMVGGLIASDTRSAYLAIAVFLGYLLVSEKKISITIRSAIIAVAFLIFIGGVIGVATHRISLDRMVTVQTRLSMWSTGIRELKQEWLLGYGLRDYVIAIDKGVADLQTVSYSEITSSTHNGFLDIALAGGVVGLLLFLMWYGASIIQVHRALHLSSIERRIGVGVLLALAVFASTSFFSIWFWIPVCMVIASTFVLQEGEISVNKRRAFSFGLGVMLFGALVLFGTVVWNSMYVSRVITAMSSRVYRNLPPRSFVTYPGAPYTTEWLEGVLRATFPTTERAVAPSYGSFVKTNVIPHVIDMETAWRTPQHDTVLGTWSSVGATSGLVPWEEWMNRSARFYEHAYSTNPNRPRTAFSLADTYRELGRVDDALALLKTVIEQNPEMPEAHLYYAVMLEIAEKFEDADDARMRALELRPIELWSREQQQFLLSHELHDHDH